jgi:preprotein translocase subunit SecA
VQRVQENRDEVASGAAGAGEAPKGTQAGNPNQVISDKTPRNAPCPCGSGLKYKKCHGAAA